MGKIIAKRHYAKKGGWRHRKAKRGWAHSRKDNWFVPDKGKKGKTKISARWSRKIKNKPSHKIVDYSIDLPQKKRRTLLRREVKERADYGAARFKSLGKMKEGGLSTKRTLQKIVNLNPNRRSDKIMKKDIKFLEQRYKV